MRNAATALSRVRMPWSLPQCSSNCLVSCEARSRPVANNRLFVGMMTMNVMGTTAPMRSAATSQRTPPPRRPGSHAGSEAHNRERRLHPGGALVAWRPLQCGVPSIEHHAGGVLRHVDVDRRAGEERGTQGGDEFNRGQHPLDSPRYAPQCPLPSGSMPPLRIAANARSEARKPISRFAASISFAPATTAAANT